jgi:hypothetical protein
MIRLVSYKKVLSGLLFVEKVLYIYIEEKMKSIN